MNYFEHKINIDNFKDNEVEWATFNEDTSMLRVYCRKVDKSKEPWYRENYYDILIPENVSGESLSITCIDPNMIIIRGNYKKEKTISIKVYR